MGEWYVQFLNDLIKRIEESDEKLKKILRKEL